MMRIGKLGCFAAILSFSASCAFANDVPVQILSAVVKDQRIAGAEVIIQKNGATSASGTTDGQGLVSLNTGFPDGPDSLIIVKKTGYSNLVAKCPCKGMTYAISPVMANLDALRIVLNWGDAPYDLDAHLAFPGNHIYFEQQAGAAGADANLDVDNTRGFGPETITISRRHAGQWYVYSVHDFSDYQHPDSTSLAHSHARVLVYIGQSLVRSYYVPNKAGNLWTVFRITPEGEFQDINRMERTSIRAPEVLDSLGTYLNASTQVEPVSVDASEEEDAVSLNKRGEQAYHAGNIEESIEYYRQAIDIDPNYGQAYSNLGLAHAKIGRYAEAIWANRKAIALASGPTAATVRASSHYNIAKIYETGGDYTNALQQYEDAKREKANPVYDKAIERMRGLVKH